MVDEVLAYCLGTSLGEILVVVIATLRVCVTVDIDLVVRILLEDFDDVVEDAEGVRFDDILRRFEVDAVESLLEYPLDASAEFRTTMVGYGAWDFRALVLVVENAVAVGILRASLLIDRGACLSRSTRALVLIVWNAVKVLIEWASYGVDLYALRRVRTLVVDVENSVAIRVERAPYGVNLHTLRRVRALVEAVDDTIAVRIVRATDRINRAADRCVRALVDIVCDTVGVGIDGTTEAVHEIALRRVRAAVLLVVDAVEVRVGTFPSEVEDDACGEVSRLEVSRESVFQSKERQFVGSDVEVERIDAELNAGTDGMVLGIGEGIGERGAEPVHRTEVGGAGHGGECELVAEVGRGEQSDREAVLEHLVFTGDVHRGREVGGVGLAILVLESREQLVLELFDIGSGIARRVDGVELRIVVAGEIVDMSVPSDESEVDESKGELEIVEWSVGSAEVNSETPVGGPVFVEYIEDVLCIVDVAREIDVVIIDDAAGIDWNLGFRQRGIDCTVGAEVVFATAGVFGFQAFEIGVDIGLSHEILESSTERPLVVDTLGVSDTEFSERGSGESESGECVFLHVASPYESHFEEFLRDDGIELETLRDIEHEVSVILESEPTVEQVECVASIEPFVALEVAQEAVGVEIAATVDKVAVGKGIVAVSESEIRDEPLSEVLVVVRQEIRHAQVEVESVVRLEGRVVGGPVLYRLHEIECVDLLGRRKERTQCQRSRKKQMFVVHDVFFCWLRCFSYVA